MYLFLRNFFGTNLSFIGSSFIAFDPRVIQNSTLGITEPLYMVMLLASLVLIQREKYQYIAFLFAGFASIVRFEGIILVPILFLFIYGRIRTKRSLISLMMFIIPVIFTLILFSYSGTNHIAFEVEREAGVLVQVTDDQRSIQYSQPVLVDRVANSFLYLGWFTFPIFIFFIPTSLYFLFKCKPFRPFVLVLMIVISASTGLWAYLDGYDTRYFFHMYPFLTVLVLISWHMFFNTKNFNRCGVNSNH